MGAGRQRKEDAIDLAVGIDFVAEIGDAPGADGLVARVHANDDAAAEAAGRELLAALTWSGTQVEAPALIHAVIGSRT